MKKFSQNNNFNHIIKIPLDMWVTSQIGFKRFDCIIYFYFFWENHIIFFNKSNM